MSQTISTAELEDIYKKASRGDAQSQHQLAKILDNEKDYKDDFYDIAYKLIASPDDIKDNREATFWYWLNKSAMQGYLPAQYDLAKKYYEIEEYEEAFALWRSLAKRNAHIESIYQIGKGYYDATISDKNIDNAILWLEKASSENYAPATSLLGKIYHEKSINAKAGSTERMFYKGMSTQYFNEAESQPNKELTLFTL